MSGGPGSAADGRSSGASRVPRDEGAVDEHHRRVPAEPLRRYVAHDARALIRFLVDAFGFAETVVYGDGDRVDHAQLSWPPGGGIMLGSVREPSGPSEYGEATPSQPGTFGAYVVTDDVDAVYERARAAGAQIIAEPHDTDYGSHDFAARDPEGNRWSFGTYRGEPRKG